MTEKNKPKQTAEALATIFTILLLCWLVFGGETTPPQTLTTTQSTLGGDAYRVCEAMDGTGLTTSCEVKAWGKTIDVRMDTTGAEARKICLGTAKMVSGYTIAFKGEWKLRIFSPYSGDQPIAVCAL
jgi:hypothetical protein